MKDATVTWMPNASLKAAACQEENLAETECHFFLPLSLPLSPKHQAISFVTISNARSKVFLFYTSSDMKQTRTDMYWPLSSHQLNKQRPFAWQTPSCLSFPPQFICSMFLKSSEGENSNLQQCRPPSMCWLKLLVARPFENVCSLNGFTAIEAFEVWQILLM